MRKIALTICILIFYLSNIYSQAKIKGKIIDDKDEPLVAAAVFIESNQTRGVYTDADGNYELEIPHNSTEKVTISYFGFHPVSIELNLKKGQVYTKNVKLVPSAQSINTVVVTGKSNLSNDVALEKMKMKSMANIDYISAATISRTGDASVINAVSRIAGVSTHSGGFITVRGISDRYIKTTINGMRIPTLDPFTNNIKLDMFPTSLINNVIITKTASPDLPGDWAGAFLSIETKDYPNKLTCSYETSFGYNSQSTGKMYSTSNRSNTDWLGYDNGLREFDHNSYKQVNTNITKYEEYEALGLSNYFNEMGITKDSPWNETYTKLGLVQLGLLDKAKFNNTEAIAIAKQEYNEIYKSQAFTTINNKPISSVKNFQNDCWDTKYKRAPIDFSQSLSFGNQYTVFSKPMGILFSIRSYNSVKFDDNSFTNKVSINSTDEYFTSSSANQTSTIENNGWSSLFILAYKPHRNHKFSMLIMPNINGINKVKNSIDEGTSQTYKYILKNNILYEERKQMVYQLKTSHSLIDSKLDINTQYSYTKGNSNAPDFKFLKYFANEDFSYIIDSKESSTNRYFRYLNEDIFDCLINASFPITKKKDLPRKLKIGGSYQWNNRNSEQYAYNIVYNQNTITVEDNSFNRVFASNQFDYFNDENGNSFFNKYYTREENPANHIIGYNKITGGFIMIDYSLTSNFLFSGGVRTEYSHIFTDAYKYNELGLSDNDARRKSSYDIMTIKPVNYTELNFLPSVNVIYKFKEDFFFPKNIRMNYSQTIARPSIRELSDVMNFDYELQEEVFGYSELKTVHIKNYDFRLESSYKNGDNFTLSFFYKDFLNHIELIRTGYGYTWDNTGKSSVKGIEFECKKNIIRNLELKTNITLVNSNTNYIQKRLDITNGEKIFIPTDTISRTMYGQAPYVINGMLSYTIDTLDLSFALSYNIQGEKLVIVSTNGAPDIYEMPRHLLDFKMSKQIFTNFSISFKIQDILNNSNRKSYKTGTELQVDYETFKYGTSYSFSLSYKL